jgi:hypothetical protein
MRRQILCLAAAAFAISAPAQPVAPTPAEPSPTTNTPAAISAAPRAQSPVETFRKLLLLSPQERDKQLSSRPNLMRGRLLAKLREYEAMPPDERELRLRATELRYYLLPLMRAAPADRPTLLARVPPDLQDLVKSRLTLWSILPPPMQQEFLAHDAALHYFAQTPVSTATNAQQEKIATRFNQFFDFTPEEKEQLLRTLSEPERATMEKTLKTFDLLPPQQRNICVRNYVKFAGMSETERAEFLKNAESWSQMSPDERKTWRDLVANVPSWPPLPPLPPMPPPAPNTPKAVKAGVATN